MSIPEYTFQSTITSLSNNLDTIVPTKPGTHNFTTTTKIVSISISIQKFHTTKHL